MSSSFKIELTNLPVNIPATPLAENQAKLKTFSAELKTIATRAGTDNDKFKAVWKKLLNAITFNRKVEAVIDNKLDVRAFGFALASDQKHKIIITPSLLDKIDQITHTPSNTFIEFLFQYYLSEYNRISALPSVSQWLIKAREKRKLNQWYDRYLISPSGPQWLAERAIREKTDFDQVMGNLGLDQYKSGQYMELAQRIYYVEQLKVIPVNQPHELLIEVQKPVVFNAQYNGDELLGHQILSILIAKAPAQNIHESWLNVIMAIAGDPRIPPSHPRYITWWSGVPNHLISKVRGWLSRLDLKLFLEALEDFSSSSNDLDMKRMYPSRKQFLEGLYDKKLILNTRLYMSRQMAQYLRRNYKAEHLPDFSIIQDNDKSIIYVDLGDAHLVEGSHSCYLWVYKSLDPSATLFNYAKKQETYGGLTAGLDRAMQRYRRGARAKITHSPVNFGWQRRAVEELQHLAVDIKMKDVLTEKDYRSYVRKFGVE